MAECPQSLRVAVFVVYLVSMLYVTANPFAQKTQRDLFIAQGINIAGLIVSAYCRNSKRDWVLATALGAFLAARLMEFTSLSSQWDASVVSVGILLVLQDVFVGAMPAFVKHKRIAYLLFVCCMFPVLAVFPAFFRGPSTDAESDLIKVSLKYSGSVYQLKNAFDLGGELETNWPTWKVQSDGTDTTSGLHVRRNADGKKDLFVFFSGSESDRDWVTNVTTAPQPIPEEWGCVSGIQVHTGFLEAFESVRQQLTEALRQEFSVQGDINRVIITGHSLGGALSTLAGLYIACLFPELRPILHVVTFGAPQVGDASFARAFDTLVPYSVRVINPYDHVPRSLNVQYVHVKGAYAVASVGSNPHKLSSYDEALNNTQGKNLTITVVSLLIFGACLACFFRR